MLERTSYRLNRWFSSVLLRTRRRLTKPGLLILVSILVTAMLGLDTEQSFAYQAFAFLVCLLLVSAVWVPFFRVRLELRRRLPKFGSVGESFSYQVVVRNRTAKLQKGLVLIERLADELPSFDRFVAASRRRRRQRWSPLLSVGSCRTAVVEPVPLPAIPPGQEVELKVDVLPLRRGALRFTGTTIARSDPFGLVRGLVDLPVGQTVLILPKRYELPSILLPGTIKYQQGGVALASSVGESQEYVFLRDYRRGDPMRHVHWRSWARTGKPIVKEFQNEFFVRHALILDTFTGPEPDEQVFEEAVALAASFACTIQTQESLLDLMFVGVEAFCFTAGRGLARTEQILEVLASVTICQGKPFRSLQDLVLQHTSALSGCVCIFQGWDEPRRNLVAQLKNLNLPVIVLLVTPPGVLPEPGAEPGVHRFEAGRIAEGLAKLQIDSE